MGPLLPALLADAQKEVVLMSFSQKEVATSMLPDASLSLVRVRNDIKSPLIAPGNCHHGSVCQV